MRVHARAEHEDLNTDAQRSRAIVSIVQCLLDCERFSTHEIEGIRDLLMAGSNEARSAAFTPPHCEAEAEKRHLIAQLTVSFLSSRVSTPFLARLSQWLQLHNGTPHLPHLPQAGQPGVPRWPVDEPD